MFDAALLVILLSPALYFFVFRPLMLQISERKQAEEALQAALGQQKTRNSNQNQLSKA
jgi:Tfp pilus assembly protein PilO